VIGAVNGPAVTGGLELALACDFLVASTQARFADTHAMVGLLPGWGGSVRLARRVGLARAKELALTGRFLDGGEALAWGLVNRVVPPERLLPTAQELAAQMLQAEPRTLRAYRRLLDEGAGLALPQALAAERRASVAHNTPVARASVQARAKAMRTARHATDSKDPA
jgi:enoyl-CoA hydratase